MAHGGGGKLSAELLGRVFLPAFESTVLSRLEDAAIVEMESARIAITTDAFVVKPLFFPGGDVGRLAVAGTVNDLAVVGARPRHLTAAFILEEGLALSDLRRVVSSMRIAANEAKVEIVAGDTKVVERGSGDGVFIVTTGVGHVPVGRSLSIANARPGDHVLLSGTIGDHGIAVLSVREGLELETNLTSDCAPLADLVERVLEHAPGTRCLRDPTRGGVTSTLFEIGAASKVGFDLDETKIPIRHEVHAACELLGFEPLHVANEGKLVVIVPENEAARALEALRSHPLGKKARDIGRVTDGGRVTLRSSIGGSRMLTQLSGVQLPRIC